MADRLFLLNVGEKGKRGSEKVISETKDERKKDRTSILVNVVVSRGS